MRRKRLRSRFARKKDERNGPPTRVRRKSGLRCPAVNGKEGREERSSSREGKK